MSASIHVDTSAECPRCNGIRAWVVNGGVGQFGEYRDYECDTCGHLWRETAIWTEDGPRYIREEMGDEEA